ncbi:MAG: amidohydrolase family protein [Bacteroidota bacterium]
MKKYAFWIFTLLLVVDANAQKIFDVHLHGDKEPTKQLQNLSTAGVYKAAVSSSWDLQSGYKSDQKISILQGLMVPCPEGKVPYSSQYCFENKSEFPDVAWVEQLMKDGKIDFLGEVLTQYYGISSSDERMLPYYELAEKYDIPVGIHTGLAGPNHGSPNFKVSLGTPMLLEPLLQKFPKLRVWIMHAGAPFLDDTIAIMAYYQNVYIDISVLNNPYIFPAAEFASTLKRFIEGGLEDRMMFGSDNGNINKIIQNVEAQTFLTKTQKEKIYFQNAETFFKKSIDKK